MSPSASYILTIPYWLMEGAEGVSGELESVWGHHSSVGELIRGKVQWVAIEKGLGNTPYAEGHFNRRHMFLYGQLIGVQDKDCMSRTQKACFGMYHLVLQLSTNSPQVHRMGGI